MVYDYRCLTPLLTIYQFITVNVENTAKLCWSLIQHKYSETRQTGGVDVRHNWMPFCAA